MNSIVLDFWCFSCFKRQNKNKTLSSVLACCNKIQVPPMVFVIRQYFCTEFLAKDCSFSNFGESQVKQHVNWQMQLQIFYHLLTNFLRGFTELFQLFLFMRPQGYNTLCCFPSLSNNWPRGEVHKAPGHTTQDWLEKCCPKGNSSQMSFKPCLS